MIITFGITVPLRVATRHLHSVLFHSFTSFVLEYFLRAQHRDSWEEDKPGPALWELAVVEKTDN